MGLSNLLGLIQKSAFKVALRIPRIKLPKLALPALLVYTLPKVGLPGFSIIGKLTSVGSGLLSSLSPLQQKLSSMFGSISNLTPGSALGFAKGILNSAYNDVSKLATGLINNAIAGATAAVSSIVNGISAAIIGIDKAVVDEINKVSQLFNTQTANIKSLLQGEINVASGNTQTIAQVSAVQATISNVITKSTTNLTNLQIKKLQEDPTFNKDFTANVTQQAINSAAQVVVAKNSMINNAAMQSTTVTKLGAAPIPPPFVINTLTPATLNTTDLSIAGEPAIEGIPLTNNQLNYLTDLYKANPQNAANFPQWVNEEYVNQSQ